MNPLNPLKPRLTDAALTAAIDSLVAHLAGEEGEGDMAETSYADMRRALAWLIALQNKRRARGARQRAC